MPFYGTVRKGKQTRSNLSSLSPQYTAFCRDLKFSYITLSRAYILTLWYSSTLCEVVFIIKTRKRRKIACAGTPKKAIFIFDQYKREFLLFRRLLCSLNEWILLCIVKRKVKHFFELKNYYFCYHGSCVCGVLILKIFPSVNFHFLRQNYLLYSEMVSVNNIKISVNNRL